MQHVDVYKSVAEAAYQGAPGAYSEEAAQRLIGPDARLMPCATLEQTFDAVVDARASHAVVPVENAVSGTVPGVYELLLAHDLVVTGETALNIDHVLVAKAGTARDAVRRVLSHPIALAQCSDYFRINRGVEAVTVFDTAGAVRMVMDSADAQTAAIASRRAAAIYGATVIAEGIQDATENWTRFVLLTPRRDASGALSGRKAIIACGLRHQPGALARSLQLLADQGLSVTKIEGRPARGKPFEYRFVIEVVAQDGRPIAAGLFEGLRATTEWFVHLGAFDPLPPPEGR
ncbi:MAG TPA: prephenate dehydratase domain-containing protein [Vicinamibacterales bacterium]|nr:prephenate dehydratase domain-containing protein [Vicinamibacterales bacterium]